MARKTFHHLSVDSTVPVQHVVWDGKSEALTVVATFQGRVVENKPSSTRLRVDVLDCQRFDAVGATQYTVQSSRGTRVEASISKQTGMEWGSEIEWGCWRIDPAHAKTK
jgi:hypothetical protein